MTGRDESLVAELVVLGAGSILPRARNEEGLSFGPAGYALRVSGEVTLFDCGPGTLRGLGPAGIDLRDVRRVVLSHFHPDHCLDLFALLFARRNPHLDEAPPLELIAPRGIERILEGGRTAFGRWVEPRRREDLALTIVDPPRAPAVIDGVGGPLELSCVHTKHTPHALAWRARTPAGETFVFSGDTGEQAAVAELAQGADLFLCECSFADEHGTEHHLTPSSAARLAERAGAKKLLLTHFYPGLEPREAARVAAKTFSGLIETASDGSVHRLR